MTDYQPLIARAVDGLAKNTGEARRALYERARTALVTQLRAVEPALSESDITKERLALEESIRKVESEAARKALSEPRAAAPPARSSGGESRFRLSGDSAEKPRRDRTIASITEFPDEAAAETQRVAAAQPLKQTDDAETEAAAPAAKPTARSRILQARTSTIGQEAVKGFRNVMQDVDGLGAATAKAAQKARETRDSYGVSSRQRLPEIDLSPPPRQGRFEPHVEEHELPPYEDGALPIHGLEPPYDLEDEQHGMGLQPVRMQPPHADEVDEDYEEPRAPRSYRGWATLAVLLFILGAAGIGAWQYRPYIAGVYQLLSTSKPQTPAPTPQTPAPTKKFPGRVPQEQVPGQAPAVAGANPGTQPPEVAQPAVLYEADPNDPQGKRFPGSVVWRTETVSPGPGLAPELVVRADISIPERHMTVTWSLRRNTDKALPASHTIEIMFNLPADFPGGGISNVPGILMKDSEEVRGMPLAGLAVKVTNGYFLIGLNAATEDMQHNLDLLKKQSWFDILIVYNNGSRAILTMEKGPPGDRAFAEAFSAWGE
jgi:hypothetical protein